MYSKDMKTFDEYRDYMINYMNQTGEVDEEKEISDMQESLRISLAWINRVLDENVDDWNTVAFQYINMDKYDIDNIDYDDVLNLGALGLICSDLFRKDEGEPPLTEL